jgi:hypothetical protein
MSITLQIILAVVVAIGAILSLVWVARDTRERGRSPLGWLLLCLITWPLGLVFWRIIRPPPLV